MERIWVSTSKRGARSSIGSTILLSAIVVVAGVIGISGIYPQAIDAEWMQDGGTHLPKISLLTTSATMKAPATAAAISPRGRHVVTTGSSPPPTPEVPSLGTSMAAVAPAPEASTPLALAEVPSTPAKVEAPGTQASPAKALDRKAKVVKRRVAQYHQRGFAEALAQFGGWGWSSGFGLAR
jgi:hypothetical protein